MEPEKELLKERLLVLKTTKNIGKKSRRTRVNGEIKYIENLLQASDFSKYNELPNL